MEIGQIELVKQVEIKSKPVWAHVSTQQTWSKQNKWQRENHIALMVSGFYELGFWLPLVSADSRCSLAIAGAIFNVKAASLAVTPVLRVSVLVTSVLILLITYMARKVFHQKDGKKEQRSVARKVRTGSKAVSLINMRLESTSSSLWDLFWMTFTPLSNFRSITGLPIITHEPQSIFLQTVFFKNNLRGKIQEKTYTSNFSQRVQACHRSSGEINSDAKKDFRFTGVKTL